MDAPLGDVTYRAEIRYGVSGPDTDAYSGTLASGERLNVRLDSPFQSGLYPKLVVEGPDGLPRDVEIKRFGRLGKRLEIREFPVDQPGRWTVRVTPELDSYGPYVIRFSVRPAPAVRAEVAADTTGAVPADLLIPFAGLTSSRIRVTVTASGKGAAPEIAEVLTPSGDPALDLDGNDLAGSARRRGARTTLDADAAPAADGTWQVRVAAPAGHRAFTVSAQALPLGRPRGVRRLGENEPWIAPRIDAARGVHDLRLRIDGRYFSFAPRAVVLLDGVPATEVEVDTYGTWITCNPPVLTEGRTVSVTVRNGDGQAYTRDSYFYYVPTPVVSDLVDAADQPVRSGTTAGGEVVRFLGAHFQTGVFIRFGTSEDVLPLIKSDTEMLVTTPPHPVGEVEVVLLDGYLHEVTAPVLFEYR